MKSICETLTIPWHAVRPMDVEKNLSRSVDEALNRIQEENKRNGNTNNNLNDGGESGVVMKNVTMSN